MELAAVRALCKTFYQRFSALNLHPFQLKFYSTPDLVSIALVNKKETVDSEAAIVIDEDSIYLLQIQNFDNIDVYFTFNTPLELYTNLLTLILQCCESSNVHISTEDAMLATLGIDYPGKWLDTAPC